MRVVSDIILAFSPVEQAICHHASLVLFSGLSRGRFVGLLFPSLYCCRPFSLVALAIGIGVGDFAIVGSCYWASMGINQRLPLA